MECYLAAGVNLTAAPVVGIGSICRRQHTREAAHIIGTLAALGLKLHGFGLKTVGLRKTARMLISADSQSWSIGMWRQGTRGSYIPWREMMGYALDWRERILAEIDGADAGQYRMAI
jgi:hypothetical protein